MGKIDELGFELFPHPAYSPDLAPSEHFLFSDLKRMLAGKKFLSNEEVRYILKQRRNRTT